MTAKRYQTLKDQVAALKAEQRLPTEPTFEQYVDWAYGTTAIENPRMTREVVVAAAERKLSGRGR